MRNTLLCILAALALPLAVHAQDITQLEIARERIMTGLGPQPQQQPQQPANPAVVMAYVHMLENMDADHQAREAQTAAPSAFESVDAKQNNLEMLTHLHLTRALNLHCGIGEAMAYTYDITPQRLTGCWSDMGDGRIMVRWFNGTVSVWPKGLIQAAQP